VLYAPTFRANAECAFSAVASAFADDRFTLVIKPHDLDSAVLGGENVVDATGVDIFDLLPIADAVITDYSAVAFEACAIEVPLLFYVYDIAEYAVDHGLNLDPLVEAPGLAFTDIEPVARVVASGDYNVEAAREFCATYGPPSDGACTSRIADLIFDHIPAS